jgi:hypothetical protein
MTPTPRTVATFKSDTFNKSEEKDYFINPSCFGDDAARWLIGRLREAGLKTDDEPGQEDFGWYFDFELPEGRHCCVLGYRPGDIDDANGDWIVWLERSRGLIGSTGLHARQRRPRGRFHGSGRPGAGRPEVGSLRWHLRQDFDANREDLAGERP